MSDSTIDLGLDPSSLFRAKATGLDSKLSLTILEISPPLEILEKILPKNLYLFVDLVENNF